MLNNFLNTSQVSEPACWLAHIWSVQQVPEKDGILHSQVVSPSREHLVGKVYSYTQAIDLLKNVDAN